MFCIKHKTKKKNELFYLLFIEFYNLVLSYIIFFKSDLNYARYNSKSRATFILFSIMMYNENALSTSYISNVSETNRFK